MGLGYVVARFGLFLRLLWQQPGTTAGHSEIRRFGGATASPA